MLEVERLKRHRNTNSETFLWLTVMIKVNLLLPCPQNSRVMGLCHIPWREERTVLLTSQTLVWGHPWGQGSQCCSAPALQPGHQ